MQYLSTRGAAPPVSFEDALLAGMAPDGGLYLPEAWPAVTHDQIRGFAGRAYADVAQMILAPFVDRAFDLSTLRQTTRDSYATFDHPAVAPLTQIGTNLWLLELFHGPTLAFKDFAMQWLARAFDHVLAARGERVTVVGATSGDTGSAAIEACRDRDNIEIFMLHPEGRVSETQRRQMTTVDAANVHNLAVRGTFDDCQAVVKALFADADFRDEVSLSAVNSINWARVLAQTVYYVTAAAALGAPARSVTFAVPTGNFGDVYAGYVATKMGLPVERLLVATNRNDILARALATGDYRPSEVHPTLSPSMDIQVASNFERLLFDLCGGDGAAVSACMTGLAEDGGFALSPEQMAAAGEVFVGRRVDEDATLAEMAKVHRETGRFIDPHTAVGVAAARAYRGGAVTPKVVLATAHPAKFPDAVVQATGVAPPMPDQLAAMRDRPERCTAIEYDVAAVRDYIRANRRA